MLVAIAAKLRPNWPNWLYWAGQAISPNSVDRLAGINHTITQEKFCLQAVGDPSELLARELHSNAEESYALIIVAGSSGPLVLL